MLWDQLIKAAGPLTFPVVTATATSNHDSALTLHTVSLPTGHASGDLCLVAFTGSDADATITFPEQGGAEWIELYEDGSVTGTRLCVGYRIFDGTEGSTINVITSFGVYSAHVAYLIQDYMGAPVVGTVTTATSTTTANPPSLSPWFGGRGGVLWIANAGAGRTITSGPSGYENFLEEQDKNADDTAVALATLESAAATEDPGTFTASLSNTYANTIAILGNKSHSFPAVAATASSSEASATTSHTLTLPTGTTDGDLLIGIFMTSTSQAHTWPGGWTEIVTNFGGASGTFRKTVYFKVASSEGSNITITSGTSATSCHLCYRISGHSDFADGTTVWGTSSTPNPQEHIPAWGGLSNLWIAIAGMKDTTESITGGPSGYSSYISNSEGDLSLGAAIKESAAATEDPPSFTASGAGQFRASTVAVRPLV